VVDLVISLGSEIIRPTVDISASPAVIQKGLSSTLTWSSENANSVYIDNGIGLVSPSDSVDVFPGHTTTYTIVALGPYGNSSASVTIEVTAAPDPQPEGSFGEKYEDLIPQDASTEWYDSHRFALITGMVKDDSGAPLTDVSVTILGYAKYGTVMTDAQGIFTIPVEGGGTMDVVYRKQGHFTAHRKLHVPWNDIAVVEDVVMISEDPQAATLIFDDNPNTVLTHRSSELTDASGTRALTMVITGDNRAWLMDEQGADTARLDAITIRSTEFRTPDSMPANLPPNSAYTYCAELAVDHVDRVRFEKPVVTWIDNFLDLAVGEIVPVGFYDRDRGIWMPEVNGVVVKLLDTDTDGVVDALDSDGDDLPDDIDNDLSYSDEVQGLDDHQIYVPGATFWRSETTHFSAWDWNFPFMPADGAIESNGTGAPLADLPQTGEQESAAYLGSYVEQKSRIIHEDIPIPGTTMSLHYDSSRVTGFMPGVITVPASGDTVPGSLKKIIVEVIVAGNYYTAELPAEPNQMAEIMWDGFDHLGRPTTGTTDAHIRIGFVYDGIYWAPDNLARAFGHTGTRPLNIATRDAVVLWKEGTLPIFKGQGTIAEGWSISDHHHLNPSDTSILFKGDGTISKKEVKTIETYAGGGGGPDPYGNIGDPANQLYVPTPSALEMDPEGNLYVFSSFPSGGGNWRSYILTIDPQGFLAGILDNITFNIYNSSIALDSQGNIYYSGYQALGSFGTQGGCVNKVTPAGVQTTVLGTCGAGDLTIRGIDVDNHGNLYAAIKNRHQVLKRDPYGTVTVVAGSGARGYGGDGGLAVDAQLYDPLDVFVDDDGNLYIAHRARVRKVDTGGVITSVAGGGSGWTTGDGLPATQVLFDIIEAVSLDRAGNIYIADAWRHSIRKVDTQGILSTVAGLNYFVSSGRGEYAGDGGAATRSKMAEPTDVLVDPNGNIFIADLYNNRVRKVGWPAPDLNWVTEPADMAFIENTGIGYIMSGAGRHKMTVDLDTGVSLYEFVYDEDGNLVSIFDQFNNHIFVEWQNGTPAAIVSPEGIRTELTVDPFTNHLTKILYEGGEDYEFEYTPDGLMTLKTEPEENNFGHRYDPQGRLTEFFDDEGGLWKFSRAVFDNGEVMHDIETRMNNKTTHLDYLAASGAFDSTMTAPTADETYYSISSDALTAQGTQPDGTLLDFIYDVDGEYKYRYLKERKETTPNGLQRVWSRNKEYQDNDADEIVDIVTDEIIVNGNTTVIENNTAESRRTTTTPESRISIVYYDPATLQTGRLIIPGLHDTEYSYDPKGRLTQLKKNIRETRIAYNPDGFIESVTDGENRTTLYDYDEIGRLTSITRPDTGLVQFEYDDNGNLTLLSYQGDHAGDHGFDYSTVNKGRAYHTPLSGSYEFSYNYDRELTAIRFPSQKQIQYTYENTQLKQIQTPEDIITFSYLEGSRVGAVSKVGETITYTFDGRLVKSESLTGTLNQSVTYSYNNDFLLDSATYAGKTFNYTYDNDSLLTGAGAFTITRQAGNGLPEEISDANWKLSRGFNLYGEVSSQNTLVNGSAIASFDFNRDNNGRITNKIETVDGDTTNYRYQYDDAGRLSKVTKNDILVEEYRYTPEGTRNYEMNASRGIGVRNYDYSDDAPQLTVGDTSYTYNDDGFLARKFKEGLVAEDDQVTVYDYSLRGELLIVNLPDARIIEYQHDPLGRRIAKKMDGTIVEKYLWQGFSRLLAVFDGSDNLLMRFEYGDDRVPKLMTRGSNTYYLTYDQIGSLRTVADVSGNVVKKIDYDVFGNIIADSDEGLTVPLGFAGGLQDRDTGLIKFGSRDYDPDIGRWTARNPIFFAGGDTDIHGYVLNDPINSIDPLGLHRWGIFSGGFHLPPEFRNPIKPGLNTKHEPTDPLTAENPGKLPDGINLQQFPAPCEPQRYNPSNPLNRIYPFLQLDGSGPPGIGF
jgi:RHS repeat-associated protein